MGGNLTETLARMGFSHLKLIDKDRVEMRNLSTQPYSHGEALMLTSLAARAIVDFLSKEQSNDFELTSNNAKVTCISRTTTVPLMQNRE